MAQEMRRRYFSLDEANTFLPYLTGRMERIRTLKHQIQTLITELEKAGYTLQHIFSGHALDETEMEYRKMLEERGDEINCLIDEVQGLGLVVKDLDLGLVDFYTRLDDDDAFLCWKLGEMDIAHWHRVDEGFRQRRNLMERGLLTQISKLH